MYFLKKKISKKNFEKKFAKKFSTKIYFSKKFKKNIRKNFPEKILRNFFLPTLVEESSSGLELQENKIFLLQWVEVG